MRERTIVAAILRPSKKSDVEALEAADALILAEQQNTERQLEAAREAAKRKVEKRK